MPQAQCKHPGCNCSVPQDRATSGNVYCSDFCEQNKEKPGAGTHGCGCNHPNCGAQH